MDRIDELNERERAIERFTLGKDGERIIDGLAWSMSGPDTPAKARSRYLVSLAVPSYLDDCARLGVNPEKPCPMPAAPIERTRFPK